jgi:hypothetical protein
MHVVIAAHTHAAGHHGAISIDVPWVVVVRDCDNNATGS